MKKLLLVILLALFLLGCKPEPRMMSQLNFYEIPDCPYPIIGKDGDVIAAPPGEIIVVEGCIRPVSELLAERDLLLEQIKRYQESMFKYEYDTTGNHGMEPIKVRTEWNPNQPSIGDHEVIVQMTLHLEDGRKELITEVWTNGQMMLANYIHEGENLDDHTVRVITDSTRQAEFKAAAKQCRKYLIYKKP